MQLFKQKTQAGINPSLQFEKSLNRASLKTMAQGTTMERQPLEVVVDETARTFPDSGNSAAVPLDGEIGADLDGNGSSFSAKPDPRLRRALWIIVPMVVFTGVAAIIGLIMHATGTSHPGSRIVPHPAATTSPTSPTEPLSPVTPVVPTASTPLAAPVPQAAGV